MMQGGDADLRTCFAHLREMEIARAPSFRHVLARRRPNAKSLPAGSSWVWLLASVITVMGTVAGYWAWKRCAPPALVQVPDEVAHLGAWAAPTDFLLCTSWEDVLEPTPTDIGCLTNRSSGRRPSQEDGPGSRTLVLEGE